MASLEPSAISSTDSCAGSEAHSGPAARLAWWTTRALPWVLTGVFALMAVRLALFVHRHAVNIVYWDQWDFLQGLFDGADPWTLFRWQHGPQRQGVANLISAVLYPATAWNGRADAAASAFVMLLSALAALWLVKRVCGGLRPSDAVVPLLFLTTANAETYVVAPNLAHGPLPVLFLTGYGLALTIGTHPIRCAALVVMNFLAVNTGFTVLLGGITPVLLLLMSQAPGLTRRDRIAYASALVASGATVAFFLYGFVPVSGAACFQFPHDRPLDYFPFAGFVLTRPFGVRAGGASTELVTGAAAAMATIVFAAYAVWRLCRSRGASDLWATTSVLSVFTLCFAASTAIGRVCMGLPAANASRYIPYVLPGVLAIYLVLRGAPATRLSRALVALFLAACILKEATAVNVDDALVYSTYKQRWKSCYLSVHDIESCDAAAGHPVHPSPDVTRLREKLDWLETRKYSLFRDRVTGRDRANR